MRPFILLLAFFVAAKPCSGQSFDHSAFDRLLTAHVVAGAVDYANLKTDRAGLERYLAQLGAVPFKVFNQWPRAEQLAFLINAYNALAIRQVIDEYPIKRSIRPAALVRPGNSVWQIDGFFSDREHRLLGQRITLDQIEHEWLRARLKEPRIHFALVCAARSCPPLRTDAYRADLLDAQLDDQARKFLNDAERNRFTTDRAQLSEIFKWFAEDFGGEPGLRRYLSRYLNPALAARLLNRSYPITYIDYDWTLNDISR